MAIIAVGSQVPEFTLARFGEADDFTQDDLRGQTTILVFYPFAFSPVCTDQLQLYDRAWDTFKAAGATQIYGVSTDPSWSQEAFRKQLDVEIEQLSDFEPKGATAKKFGAYFEPAGMTNRAIVIVGPDAVIRFAHLADAPSDLPPVELVLAGLQS